MNTKLTTPQARYLKHSGNLIDVKVTIRIVDNEPVIYIRDSEIRSFSQAIGYLQRIVESEMVNYQSKDE